jgi:hypothetical protein
MGEADRFAWAWYATNASLFVQEYGLMPKLIDDLALEGVARDLFIARLSLIHSTIVTIQRREAEKRAREK